MSFAVEFVQLGKRFGATQALSDVSFNIPVGACFGLAGVNGAGKTTLLKCLLDFCLPDHGAVRLFGQDARRPQSRARLAYLPERFVPPHYLTAGDFLRYMAQLHQQPWQDQPVRRRLAALELDIQVLAQPVRQLSKGMTQKLGLLATLLSQKDFLVLDEPMSGLDPKARSLVKQLLIEQHDEGRTLLFTTHALADIAELCDEMAILHAGRLCFLGSPSLLQQQHAATTLEQGFLRCIER